MRIGLLTGGGDGPAINACIRAIVRKSISFDWNVIGFRLGWRGILNKDYKELSAKDISGILHHGGTMLGTSRTNPFKIENGPETIVKNLKDLEISTLIAIGGDDTLGVCHKLAKMGVKAVGIPQTIDNDINETDYALGYDTAQNIVMEAIDRLHTTAASHHRILVVEIMGRDAGWLALLGGVAGGADVILIPEVNAEIEAICDTVKLRHAQGKDFSIIAVAEGFVLEHNGEKIILKKDYIDQFGHQMYGGIGFQVAGEIEKRTGFETRVTVLGHLQRGGAPTAFDRVLATRFGVKAVELVQQNVFDQMVCMKGLQVTNIPLEKALVGTRTVDMELYNISKLFV